MIDTNNNSVNIAKNYIYSKTLVYSKKISLHTNIIIISINHAEI